MGIEEFLLDRAWKEGEAKGIEKGMEKGMERIIRNFLRKKDFTLEQIAEIAGVSVSFVEAVKKNMD